MSIKGLRPVILAVFFIVSSYGGALAGNTSKISWEDLLPKVSIPENPVVNLSTDLQVAFENIDYWQNLASEDKAAKDQEEIADLKKAVDEAYALFKREGVNLDRFYKQYNAYLDAIDNISKTTVKKYNAKQVKIAGYLLPLEFDKRGVKDFLLVPYVGACIHVPAPPANQTIFVRMKNRYKFKDLFDPVWVSGSIKNSSVTKELSLVDGENDIETGYTLSGNNISTYLPPIE